MEPEQSVDYVSKLWPVLAGIFGGLFGWLLGYDRMRRDVSDIKEVLKGGPDDWSLPEMRRQLKAAWVEIEKLKLKAQQLELADAASVAELKGYVNAQKDRIDLHAKRTDEQQVKNAEFFAQEARSILSEIEARIQGGKGA
jgi:hypothetical protein